MALRQESLLKVRGSLSTADTLLLVRDLRRGLRVKRSALCCSRPARTSAPVYAGLPVQQAKPWDPSLSPVGIRKGSESPKSICWKHGCSPPEGPAQSVHTSNSMLQTVTSRHLARRQVRVARQISRHSGRARGPSPLAKKVLRTHRKATADCSRLTP